MSNSVRPFRGHTPELGQNVFIDKTAVVLGDVKIGDESSIWPMAVVRGDMHSIRIGARTSIQDGSVIHITHGSDFYPGGFPVSIGDDVTVGHKATLHGCTIHNRCLIGIGSIVMDGVVVEEEVIVAAGAMVPPGKTLESGFVYKGNPAKKARPITDKERQFFTYGARNYAKLGKEHAAAGFME